MLASAFWGGCCSAHDSGEKTQVRGADPRLRHETGVTEQIPVAPRPVLGSHQLPLCPAPVAVNYELFGLISLLFLASGHVPNDLLYHPGQSLCPRVWWEVKMTIHGGGTQHTPSIYAAFYLPCGH